MFKAITQVPDAMLLCSSKEFYLDPQQKMESQPDQVCDES